MNLLYFLLIGWWLAPLWACAAILLCWNPIGWVMMHQVPKIAFGE